MINLLQQDLNQGQTVGSAIRRIPLSISVTQHVEWDLNKTSKTITEALLALTLMLYGSQKNVV